MVFCLIAKGQLSERTFYGGIMYKSSGLGINYQNKLESAKGFGKQFDIDLCTYHHQQESKSFNTELNNPAPFIFGKINRVAILKTQYSITHKLSGFTDAQRVGLDLVLGGGISIGFLKPVYINLVYPNANGYETLVSEKYDPNKHTDKTKIAGYTDSRVGWSEIATKAGISLSAGIGFTWGYFTNFPKRLETGFYLEYFDKGLPVMAFAKNKRLNEGMYLKVFLGKRVSKN